MVISTLESFKYGEVHKMTNYKEKIINIQTGEETYRDYTAAEIKEVEKAQASAQLNSTKQAEAETAKASAQAKLAALGLTANDLKALGLGNN